MVFPFPSGHGVILYHHEEVERPLPSPLGNLMCARPVQPCLALPAALQPGPGAFLRTAKLPTTDNSLPLWQECGVFLLHAGLRVTRLSLVFCSLLCVPDSYCALSLLGGQKPLAVSQQLSERAAAEDTRVHRRHTYTHTLSLSRSSPQKHLMGTHRAAPNLFIQSTLPGFLERLVPMASRTAHSHSPSSCPASTDLPLACISSRC